jgi:hypothetical protein
MNAEKFLEINESIKTELGVLINKDKEWVDLCCIREKSRITNPTQRVTNLTQQIQFKVSTKIRSIQYKNIKK